MRNVSRDSQCPGQGSNQATPEYKFRAIPLEKPVQRKVGIIYSILSMQQELLVPSFLQ
jgi:hypothetical protein